MNRAGAWFKISNIEESNNSDVSNADFESQRDNISNDKEVDEERMKKSFQEVWDCGTQKLASQINEIEAFSYEEEEGESVENSDTENEDSSIE